MFEELSEYYIYPNPYNSPILSKGKGINEDLKRVSYHIHDKIFINLNKNYTFSFNEYNFKFKNLKVNIINDDNIKTIDSQSIFGAIEDEYSMNSTINLIFDIKNYNVDNLRNTIIYEILHLFELYKRNFNNIQKDLSYKINNYLQQILPKYQGNNFLKDFIYLLYLSTDNEIDVMISQTYIILMNSYLNDKNKMYIFLKNIQFYKNMEYLKYFDLKNYNINIELTKEFLNEYDSFVNSINIKKFNLFNKKVITDNDVISKIKKYKKLFYKKSLKFEQKLLITIGEVIDDKTKLYENFKPFELNYYIDDDGNGHPNNNI